MMNSHVVVLTLFFMLSCLQPLRGQTPASGSADICQRIEEAHRRGEIDFDTALLNKAYALIEPSRLDRRFTASPVPVGKCGTPLLREIRDSRQRLTRESQNILAVLLDTVGEKDETYDSPGGHFKLHYDRTGRDGVSPADGNLSGVPDYIERAALIFDSVWTFEVDSLGYPPPPPDGGFLGDDRYDVVFEDMYYYGYTLIIDGASPASFITIENDFYRFPPNDDPEGNVWGALKVTAAHEFFHACQYVYDTDEAVWFSEVTAVWMEETAFDGVNDYYNYLPGFFSHPEEGLTEGFPYEKVVWALYLSQHFGRDVIADLWAACGTVPGDNALTAHDPVLLRYGTTVPETFKGFSVWNYLTGDRAAWTHSHYEEASRYPQVTLCAAHSVYPVNERPGCPLDHLASSYLSFSGFETVPPPFELGFAGRQDMKWGVMLLLIDDSGPEPVCTPVEMLVEHDGTGHALFLDSDDTSRIVLVPSLLSSAGLNVPFTYSAGPPRPLTIKHQPLADTMEIPGSFLVAADVSPADILNSGSVRLHYNLGWKEPPDSEVIMHLNDSSNLYEGDIPAPPAGTVVNYFLSASDTMGRIITAPAEAPDSVYRFVVSADTVAPSLEHLPPPWLSDADFPLDLSAVVTDPYGLRGVDLFYTNGSSSGETVITMTASGSVSHLYVGTIPPVFAAGDTLLYRIEAADGSPQGNTARYPASGYRVIEIEASPAMDVVLTLQTGWNLVSLPVVPDDGSVAALFPDNAGVFAWSGNGYYKGSDSMRVGYGYWVAMLESRQDTLSGVPVGRYSREIREGWNLVGCGGTVTDPTWWQSSPEGALLRETVTWYDPASGMYVAADTLEPGKGYWVASVGDGALTFQQEGPAGDNPKRVAESFPLASLCVSRGDVICRLSFGCAAHATAGFDPYLDGPCPPVSPDPSAFEACFIGSHGPFDRLRRDIRPEHSDQTWTLSVDSDSPVMLSWDVSTLCPGTALVFKDEDRSVDMRGSCSHTLDGGGRYEIVLERTVGSPAAITLYPNYPNPFNPETAISYQLSAVSEGTTHHSPPVTLKVYNLLGQEIRTLVDEVQEPGLYTVTWNGRDTEDRPVSSGIYYTRLHVGEFNQVQKVMLLK